MVTLYSYRVYLVLVVYLVFLSCSIQDFLVRIGHVAVDIHQFIDHLL
ncbi:Uncharacterised protein [Segatella copri]|nr:Uncharacterised protein [Segatella copri]